MVAHIYNPSIQMTEAGGWSQVQGEPELQSEILKDLKQIILKNKLKNEREWYSQVFVCKVCL